MNKINHALVIDDQIDLLIDGAIENNAEYKSLKAIQDYFLKNSIPFSVINNIGDSPVDAIERIKLIPKPDLVVLDLDLNSDGSIDDNDVSLLTVILKELHTYVGDYIILIYSSQAERWNDIRGEIIEKDQRLNQLLNPDNVIIFEKFFELTNAKSELISTEILNKADRYFQRKFESIKDLFKKTWNKEIAAISFFIIALIVIIKYSYSSSSSSIAYSAIAIIAVITLKLIFSPFKS